ncbi:hypothetical protein A2U01_0088842, partial [Trifolium medium]|nr:hypothetical protein [Trifolium medium]
GNYALRRLAAEGLEKPLVVARRAGGTSALRHIRVRWLEKLL